MSASSQATKPAASSPARPARAGKAAGGAGLTQGAGREAKQLAAAILEVLAGARTPAQAATALGWSLPRYYQREAQALRGLLAGCEPRPPGRTRSAEAELARLRQEQQRLERALARQQALVRLTQRAAGLPAATPAAAAAGKRRRKAAARAVPLAARLRQEAAAAESRPAAPPKEGLSS
jgi:hypothetical protein